VINSWFFPKVSLSFCSPLKEFLLFRKGRGFKRLSFWGWDFSLIRWAILSETFGLLGSLWPVKIWGWGFRVPHYWRLNFLLNFFSQFLKGGFKEINSNFPGLLRRKPWSP